MTRNRRSIFACLIGAIIGLWVSGAAAKQSAATPSATGTFTVYIRGYWTGSGTAFVNGKSVQIVATVSDDAGNTGKLLAQNLTLVDDHFTGAGTVIGLPMQIQGRVDAMDPPSGSGNGKGKGKGKGKSDGDDDTTQGGGPVLTDGRITAIFAAAGHRGRLAGKQGN